MKRVSLVIAIDGSHLAATAGITGTQLADGSVSNADLGADAVTSNKVAAGAIDGSHIAATAGITGTQIANGSVSNAELGADAVTSNKVAAGAIDDTHIVRMGAEKLLAGSSVAAINSRSATNNLERNMVWTDTTMDALTLTNAEHTLTASDFTAGPVFSLTASDDCTNLTVGVPGGVNLGRPTTLVNGVGSNMVLQAASTILGCPAAGITFEDQYDSVTLIGFDANSWLVVNKNLAD